MTLTYRPFAKSDPRPKDDAVGRIMAQMRRDAARRAQLADAIVARMARGERFAHGVKADKGPGKHDGSVPFDVRMRGAVGHDSRGKYKVSGPATPFGQPGRSTKLASR